ncbi:hypothetical protein QL285_042730 [Trifolium repens]|nr:hypothetical protein QL285_042730 [Trifolium repens]
MLDLILLLEQFRPKLDVSDKRRWISLAASVFSVKTTYATLQNILVADELESMMVKALKKLWSSNVPSIISIFGWRLLLDKLPTREALFSKGIITNNLEICCVFCFNEIEDVQHVFFNCSVIVLVWKHIFKWI